MAKNWQHAIISGGASGLGQGLAERLLRRWAAVSVVDLGVKPERAAALDAAALQGKGHWRLFTADITDEAAAKSAVDATIAARGPADLGINSAGIGLAQSFADMPSAAFKRMIDVNLIGSYHFAAALIPHLRKGDRLAFVASMAGITSN
jgi:3-dehydrosphinganine reductase